MVFSKLALVCASTQGRIQKNSLGGQKLIFAPPNLPFPYIYHVKGGQFGGGQKRIFGPEN